MSQTDSDKTPFEVQFFNGGINQTFESFFKTFGLSPNSLEFLDFLQCDECKEILPKNKL